MNLPAPLQKKNLKERNANEAITTSSGTSGEETFNIDSEEYVANENQNDPPAINPGDMSDIEYNINEESEEHEEQQSFPKQYSHADINLIYEKSDFTLMQRVVYTTITIVIFIVGIVTLVFIPLLLVWLYIGFSMYVKKGRSRWDIPWYVFFGPLSLITNSH
jgi:hypothetical protein